MKEEVISKVRQAVTDYCNLIEAAGQILYNSGITDYNNPIHDDTVIQLYLVVQDIADRIDSHINRLMER